MYKNISIVSLLVLLSGCGTSVNTTDNLEVNQPIQALSTTTSSESSDISQETANKISLALDLNGDKLIDSDEVHLNLKNNISNYSPLDKKALAPIPISKVTSTLMSGGTVSLSNGKAVNDKVLSNLSKAFSGDSINSGSKVKVFSTNIPYLAISKTKTIVANLNPEQLSKKLNDGLSGIGMIDILGSSKLIANQEKSRIKFSIYADLDKKLPIFSSSTYSNAEIK